ncbi:MAG: cob(I)yrinic acid a,c-diamide adenosyltransferase [Thiotrichales bacterium]|nr:cob(I)yrinic acid a,c-diamide adenosyltransferase [Thiotrichales bacterium]MBT4653164.1 cob(I)yrinic acid a,c-diamide adenosyltransferase [Thiotrichales bacterium]MBT7149711.1 cob(I)yrinic acid a,c-diamide adenosyltransferase [Thiotrichales bacterium]MBT7439493.1 cob(I)yrinic acid a,c-diamide adenosyltransferase [Thiotrichales bacterium]
MMTNSYKKRMQRKKEYIDSRIDEASIDKGIIVLLTGNGKGKSSSAMGMICRALGYGMRVALVRFLKGEQQTGEDLFLENHPNIVSAHMESGFTWNTQDQELDKKRALVTWNEAKEFLKDPEISVVVLDEITYMINYKYLDESDILETLSNRPENQHVVITGRAASRGLIDASDTVSEIEDIKHAFRANIRAQKGIDL